MPSWPPFFPSYPWFTGGGAEIAQLAEVGGVTDCVPNTITLDGYTFAVDLKEWDSGPLDTFRDTIVTNDQPNDTLFNARGAWARYRYSWHHGSGQSLGDIDTDADNFRSLSSYGIDWKTRYQLRLLHAAQKNQTIASSTPVMCQSGIYVFVADGTTLYRSSDLITWTAMTAPGGTINALASDGTDLYVATTTKLTRYLGSGTTDSPFGTPINVATDNVAFCSGRLLAGHANVLKEVAAAGTETTIKTHYQAAFRWTTIFNIGSRIYIGGFSGTRSELHTVSTDSAGALVQSQEAAPLPNGELLRTGVSFAGAAILCTSNGVRVAEVSGDGTLTYGPLINDVGDVRCACADGQYVFTGWTNQPGGRSGVARLVMDDEVRPLQPAYGTDIASTDAVATVFGVARLNGQTCFVTAANGIWVESLTVFEGGGHIDSGRLSFGTVELKGLVQMTVVFAPLNVTEVVTCKVYDDDGTLIGSGNQATQNATSLEIDLHGAQASFCSVVIEISGPGNSSPTIYRWRMRAYPIPPAVLQWTLALQVYERTLVNIGEGQIQSMNAEDVHRWIEQLAASRRLTVLRIGTRVYHVRVETFKWRDAAWATEGDGPEGKLFIQLIAT